MQRRFISLLRLAVSATTALLLSCSLLDPTRAADLGVATKQEDRTDSFLPVPPRQNDEWTPPFGSNTASFSPAFLSAVPVLFAQGVADPRGGDYESITVQTGSVWRGDGGITETHGWVFPEKHNGQKFAACWNGLVYPVIALKGRASLQEDVEFIKNALSRAGQLTRYSSDAFPEKNTLALEFPSLLKVALLLRLGENSLAASTYRVWTKETPPGYNNRNILQDPYLNLATQWAWSLYDRAVCAQMRGADRLAFADAELLTRVQPRIEAEAAKRDYNTYPNGGIYNAGESFLPFLENLPALRRDVLRRVAAGPQMPLDVSAVKKLPQKERIILLIRHLDEINERQSGQPGGVGLDAHPVPQALISEGDAAVEPLLDVMEKDDRLTRSVSFGRDFFQQRNLLSVKSAAFACFARITDVTQIGGQKPTVAILRAWWAKNKSLSNPERWLAQLADDGPVTTKARLPGETYKAQELRRGQEHEEAHYTLDRWEEAAQRIVERSNIRRYGVWTTVPRNEPGKMPSLKGEPLRARRNPSVSDLLEKRALQISHPEQGRWGFDYASGANFALMLYEWEPRGHQTLPTLQTLMRRCLDFFAKQPKEEGNSDQYQLGGRIARLTIARLRLGDTKAVSEYGDWLETVSPKYFGYGTRSALLVFSEEPDNLVVQQLGQKLFSNTQSASATAWNNLFADPNSPDNHNLFELTVSSMIRLPAFRELIEERLKESKVVAGNALQKADNEHMLEFVWLSRESESTAAPTTSIEQRQELRLCDRMAVTLQRLAGVPRFNPFASIAERDKQCFAIAAYIKEYEKTFFPLNQLSRTLYGYDGGNRFDYLGPAFSKKTKPATEKDVREKRAVFAVSGSKVRVVPNLPLMLPIEARWSKDADVPGIVPGLIWQAEEIWENGKWVRYYGFVGPHSIAKVPASEIQITDHRMPRPTTPQATH